MTPARIDELRRRAGLSKSELALAAGISPSLLSLILKGERRVTDGVREGLAAALGVSPLELAMAKITVEDLLRIAEVSSREELTMLVDEEWHEGRVTKSDGSYRTVAEPPGRLKALQYWVLRQVLDPGYLIHPFAFGGVPGRSAYDNARVHVGAQLLVKLDIVDFFGSISPVRVFEALRGRGPLDDDAAKAVSLICTRAGKLPQGAPTSPSLANIVALELDQALLRVVPAEGLWRYTRYVDDLTFSTIVPDARAGENVLKDGKRVLREYGFKPHRDKCQVVTAAERMLVTGFLINPSKVAPVVRAPREQWKRLRTAVKKLEDGGALESWETVWGLASYLGETDKERAEPFKERLRKLREE